MKIGAFELSSLGPGPLSTGQLVNGGTVQHQISYIFWIGCDITLNMMYEHEVQQTPGQGSTHL